METRYLPRLLKFQGLINTLLFVDIAWRILVPLRRSPPAPTRGRSAAFDTGEDGPNILTQGTGGFMVRNLDDMSRAFGLFVRDTSTYYVIGYHPANPTMDGKYLRIEVKSKKAGLNVRARKGYAAVALPPQERLMGGGR